MAYPVAPWSNMVRKFHCLGRCAIGVTVPERLRQFGRVKVQDKRSQSYLRASRSGYRLHVSN